MSPRTNEQFEEIRNEKKRLILDAGLKLFSEKGYANTSISQIAKEAGISKGLMYNYFESKDELLQNVMKEGIDSLLSLYDVNKDGVLEPHEMEFFINESFRVVLENTHYWRLYFQVVMQAGVMDKLQMQIAQVYEKVLSMSMRYFSKMGFEDPAAEAIIFGSTMDGISMQFIAAPDQFPVETVKKALVKRYCTPQGANKYYLHRTI